MHSLLSLSVFELRQIARNHKLIVIIEMERPKRSLPRCTASASQATTQSDKPFFAVARILSSSVDTCDDFPLSVDELPQQH